MSIDWITVAAQIVNFLALIWLLKRFLYRPILDGIAARETEIAERMAEAEQVRAQAEKTQAAFEARSADLDAARERIRSEVRAAAEADRDALLAEARERVRHEAEAGRADREAAARRLEADLKIRGADALLGLTRKALSDLADEELEHRIVSHALQRLPSMMATVSGIEGGTRDIVVTTRYPLPDALQERLTERLGEIRAHPPVSYRTDRAQSHGLSLRIGGTELGWSVSDYLDGLQVALRDNAAPPPEGTEGRYGT